MMQKAPFFKRFLAHFLDFVLVNGVELGLEYGLLGSLGIELKSVTQQAIGVAFSLVLTWIYYVEIPVRRGTTFGKMLFDLYVVDAETGEPFTKKTAVIRMFAYLLSYLTMGCGFLMALFNSDGRALHDLVAGTRVVIKPKK